LGFSSYVANALRWLKVKHKQIALPKRKEWLKLIKSCLYDVVVGERLSKKASCDSTDYTGGFRITVESDGTFVG
jgi:hypothetical protein